MSQKMDCKNGLTVLTRIAARNPEESHKLEAALKGRLEHLAPLAIEVALETGDPIGQTLACVLSVKPDPTLANDLRKHIPKKTVALREVALEVMQQCIDAHKIQNTNKSRREVAALLNDTTWTLTDLNRYDEALAAIEEAVELYRTMQATCTGAVESGLAMSLNNLGIALGIVGRLEDALDATKEAATFPIPPGPVYSRTAMSSELAHHALRAFISL